MAQFEAYNKLLISKKEEIQNYKIGGCVLGFVFHSQYPSYRGTYLSCIESMTVKVDGKKVPEKNIYFHINGKQFLVSEFKDLYKEYWFILDKAKILVLQDGGIAEGEHEISMTMVHKIPYTGYFGNYMSLTSKDTKKLQVKGEVDIL